MEELFEHQHIYRVKSLGDKPCSALEKFRVASPDNRGRYPNSLKKGSASFG